MSWVVWSGWKLFVRTFAKPILVVVLVRVVIVALMIIAARTW